MATSKINIPLGTRCGSLLVTGPETTRAGRPAMTCLCDCGKITAVTRTNLSGGKVSSCGCSRLKYKNLVGKKFGLLTVSDDANNGLRRKRYVICNCQCGKVCERAVRDLVAGASISCGCYIRKRTKFEIKHGQSRRSAKTPEYKIWCSMLARCGNPAGEHYDRYGGRGIIVCKKWQDFSGFFADMGERPTPKHSIERRDNDGNYEPENCMWATKQDQAINRSSSLIVEYNGEKIALARLAAIHGVSVRKVRGRIQKLGWSVERALHEPFVVGKNQYS